MAKKIIGNLKLRIPAGRATAGPPVGSTLGQWGLNMMDFINPFNDATKDMMGKDVIVHIQVYEDRTFTWNSLGQPVDDMIVRKLDPKGQRQATTQTRLVRLLAHNCKKSLRQKRPIERNRHRRCNESYRRISTLNGR